MQYTTILHAVRKQFGLSCNEYCVADMVYHLSNNPKAPVQGWCNQSRGNMAAEMGLSRRTIIEIVKLLVDKGLVERNESDFLRTTTLWYDSITGCAERLQGVQKLHTDTRAETSQGVQNLHGGCAETSQDGCAETSHNNKSIDNKSNNKESIGAEAPALPEIKETELVAEPAQSALSSPQVPPPPRRPPRPPLKIENSHSVKRFWIITQRIRISITRTCTRLSSTTGPNLTAKR